jgi:hypothetical protein
MIRGSLDDSQTDDRAIFEKGRTGTHTLKTGIPETI